MTEVGRRLERLEQQILNTCNKAEVAVIFDWENWWAVEDAAGPRLDMNYKKTFLKHYRAFWEMGIDADVLNMDYELDGYRVVVAPMNYLYKAGYAKKVKKYVENGGIYITTCWSGIVDENDLCFTGEHPLREVLGIRQEEIDAPGEEFRNSISFGGKTYTVGELCEVVHKESGQVLHVYEKEFYAGSPAVVKNEFGKGCAYYLAAEFGREFYHDFYKECLGKAGIENPLKTELPYGVTVSERKGENSLIFLQISMIKGLP